MENMEDVKLEERIHLYSVSFPEFDFGRIKYHVLANNQTDALKKVMDRKVDAELYYYPGEVSIKMVAENLNLVK